MEKERLFLSYNWKDGNVYADELESQLSSHFDVRRDKTQLIANDDIYDFMADIANCENVIIILTEEYVKSLNCMLEMSFLVMQPDWKMKAMVLVIDDSLYSTSRKMEIISYWRLQQAKLNSQLDTLDDGKTILEEEKGYVDSICNQVEQFLKGISRRKNPSQIAIVSEIIKKSEANKTAKKDIVRTGEEYVKKFLAENGNLTIRQLSEKTGTSPAAIHRMVRNLVEQGQIEKNGAGRFVTYAVKE